MFKWLARQIAAFIGSAKHNAKIVKYELTPGPQPSWSEVKRRVVDFRSGANYALKGGIVMLDILSSLRDILRYDMVNQRADIALRKLEARRVIRLREYLLVRDIFVIYLRRPDREDSTWLPDLIVHLTTDVRSPFNRQRLLDIVNMLRKEMKS